MSIRKGQKGNILSDEFFSQNCKDYIGGMNMNLIISNYTATPRNPLYAGIKPPRDIRPPAISSSIDIVAVNNAQKLQGNKNKIAREIMKAYEVKAQNFKNPKVTGVQELYSKKLYNKNNDFDKYFNNYFHENSHNLDNVNVSAPRNYVITGMSQSQAMLSQAIGSQSQPPTPQPPIPPPQPQPPTPPTPQPQPPTPQPPTPQPQPPPSQPPPIQNHQTQKYLQDASILIKYILTKGVTLEKNDQQIILRITKVLNNPSNVREYQAKNIYLRMVRMEQDIQKKIQQQQPSSSNTPMPPEVEKMKKENLIKAYYRNIENIKNVGTDAESKLNLFLSTQQPLTLETDYQVMKQLSSELHRFIVNNSYPTYQIPPPTTPPPTPLPHTPTP